MAKNGSPFITAAIFHSFIFGKTKIIATLVTKLSKGIKPKEKGILKVPINGLNTIPKAMPILIAAAGIVSNASHTCFIGGKARPVRCIVTPCYKPIHLKCYNTVLGGTLEHSERAFRSFQRSRYQYSGRLRTSTSEVFSPMYLTSLTTHWPRCISIFKA